MSRPDRIVLGTRGSALALAQTECVRAGLAAAFPDLLVEVEILRTRGDERLDLSLQSTSPLDKGLFTKELELALAEGRIDAAIHSLKDLPVEMPPGLSLAALLPREDPADVLISRPECAVDCVATSSPRRALQWLEQFPETRTREIRGNVPTRLRKVREATDFQAAILALAGLKRLGLANAEGQLLETPETEGLALAPLPWMLAAPGQGAIAVQTRSEDPQVKRLFQVLHCSATWAAVTAERALLTEIGGGCHQALGTRAWVDNDSAHGSPRLHLRAVYFPAAQSPGQRGEVTVPAHTPELAAKTLINQWKS